MTRSALLVICVAAVGAICSSTAAARYQDSPASNPPETYILLDTIEAIRPNIVSQMYIRPRQYYSLPERTSTYSGLTIAWQGSDSTDHPGVQPPFVFNWVLFGPYSDYDSATVDSSNIARTNDNPATPELEWTSDVDQVFYDLRSGWYLFSVRARDDSLDIDPTPTPAQARLQVVEPSFTRPYMILDATNWFHQSQSDLMCGEYVLWSDSLTVDTMLSNIYALFEAQPYPFDRTVDVWHRMTFDTRTEDARPLPNRDILAQYQALVVIDEDRRIPLDMDQYPGTREYEHTLSDYMAVGGRVILIGRNLFAASADNWNTRFPPMVVDLPDTTWGFKYFGVTQMFFPNMSAPAIDSAVDVSEFVSARPVSTPFFEVSADTIRTMYLCQIPKAPKYPHQDRNGDGALDWLWIPDVNWIAVDRSRGAAGIYAFNAADPSVSSAHGRLCGAWYMHFDTLVHRYTYRTAIVTFPLWTMRANAKLISMIESLLRYALPEVPTGVADEHEAIAPREHGYLANYPNPFNTSTSIRYSLPAPSSVTLTIHNILGQRVRVLVDQAMPAGEHEVKWNGQDHGGGDVASGVYFIVMQAGSEQAVRKAMVVR